MKILPFKESAKASIGTELEFQLIHPTKFSLISRSPQLIHKIKENADKKRIKPEITQSMIEINSSIHHSPNEMLNELIDLQKLLMDLAKDLNIEFCGGGTHPFQEWHTQKVFPAERYKRLSKVFQYLCKRATVFGQHVHVGCENGEDALYLTHALIRYAPQFIAICAASPFYQGVDTGFFSTRTTIFGGFPMTGLIPFITNWKDFSAYFYKLQDCGIIQTMKDVYWDVRPKPEFGTVEVRVCDCPLSIKKAVQVAAYIQALSFYLLENRPFKITHDLYYFYGYNRFQASRYGYDGRIIDPITLEETTIYDDIIKTIKLIESSANQLNTKDHWLEMKDDVIKKNCDAGKLREIYNQVDSLPKVVEEQCKIWKSLK